jgi:DNA-binding response OmpR family regulator
MKATTEVLRSTVVPPSSDREFKTVLVVEDDESLRRLVRDCLERAGYLVVAVGDGVLGLAEFKRHPWIGMLLTDVQMPNMDGIRLAQHVKELDKGLPILFMSGTAPETDCGYGCLQKPFGFAELVARVQTILPVNIAQT